MYQIHTNPFSVLGPHWTTTEDRLGVQDPSAPKVWTVRAYQPNTQSIALIDPSSQRSWPMASVAHPDLFEVSLEEAIEPYQLKVVRSSGATELLDDPYSFAPEWITDVDQHLFGEGNHHRIYEKMGAHLLTLQGVSGVHFAVWAPNARSVSVVGDFNHWDRRIHPMQRLSGGGIWALFVPGLEPGELYKFGLENTYGHFYEKTDPFGFQQEVRPQTASIITDLSYVWNDQDWLETRKKSDPLKRPISIYELHLGSWMHVPEEGDRFLTYRELAPKLSAYVKEQGFTHIELMPILEHPFDGSWGYQVIGHYAPTSRYGTPTDFKYFMDYLHQQGIGVILDWVPGHFPKDAHGLREFDGTCLFEHADPRKGEHKEWGTLIFNYGRNEVRNFLVANVLYWFAEYHIDGIRVDAVASMLYLDYSREEGEWVPNQYGGRENIEAIQFLQQLNSLIFEYFPGALSIAEESTAWPMVTWPTSTGGLGFNLKWNMGWMHDNLEYFSVHPHDRKFHHNKLTFSIMYYRAENYVLALSHDEVVHGKSSLLYKMPGNEWEKFASVRALLGFMYGHPGKKNLFMGMEFGQTNEWNVWTSLDWHLLKNPIHQKLKKFSADLNHLYSSEPAFYEGDYSDGGFYWVNCDDRDASMISFIRQTEGGKNFLLFVCNFSANVYDHYRVGVPQKGFYQELLNSDAEIYGGSNQGNMGGLEADEKGYNGQPYSLGLRIPPLAVSIFKLINP